MFPGVAVITGAGGTGIGAATAKAFAAAGCERIAITDLNEKSLQTTAKAIASTYPKTQLLVKAGNVADDQFADSFIDAVVQQFGRVDYAVNCAGVLGKSLRSAETSLEEFDRVNNINYRGCWLSSRAELRQMVSQSELPSHDPNRPGQRGAVVNVASQLGIVSRPGAPAYCASKSAVIGMTRADGIDYSKDGIRVNCVCPGVIETPLIMENPEIRAAITPAAEIAPMKRMAMDSAIVAQELLQYLRFGYPPILLGFIFIVFLVHSSQVARNADRNIKVQYGPNGKPLPRRTRMMMAVARDLPAELARNRSKGWFVWLDLFVLATYIAEAAIHMTHAIVSKSEQWWCGQAVVFFVVGAFFTHTVIFISLLENRGPSIAQFVPWLSAIPFEIAILSTSISIYSHIHHEPTIEDPFGGRLRTKITFWEALEISAGSVRIFVLTLLVASYIFKSARKHCAFKEAEDADAGETTSLLDSRGNANSDDGDALTDGQQTPEVEAWVRPLTTPSTNWMEYLSGYSLFFPYLWPYKSLRLQIVVVMCFAILIVQRAVNILVPYQVGVIADSLSTSDGNLKVPWMPICLYIIYRWLQGSQGFLESVRSNLWISVSQYAYMELSTASFEHVHNLGLDFHLGKKMGEVLSALTKGNSINTFLEQVTFQVLPMFIDLTIAIGYFLIVFDVYYALAVAVMTFFYLYSTIKIASWRANMRRQMVNASRQEDAVKNDSLVSYETVKYFNAEEYEFNRYRGAVSDYLRAEWHSLFAQNLMNICQNVIFMFGLLITCFICAYQVARGQRPVGQFVTLLTYMAQLQAPLNIFGTFYRYIQSALINAERLLELFRVQPSVVDAPSATPLAVCHGRITFNEIKFSYDTRRPALNGLTFDCKPGTTTALVGESGGGKSTIFRLLYRFYNPSSGNLLIDGYDTQTLTIDSVRRHIGVVPQDTVLFNETIMYNLKYANQNATDEEVYEACRAASVHDKIMAFPDGYETKVGDRGLRLSGGEKQRVAIARTIIKKPQIILLDEATAALDSETEQNIQEALAILSRGRTVLVIAHRLSTITTADNIVVLHEGRVAETGTHEQLLAANGRYKAMWQKQIRAQTESVGLNALSGKI
ncbi:hypothetical protein CBS147339_457 [Penicillium roqueforti]|nr:hypothetical protein CBS147339_457 [Penicillium roqueforti]KAI3097435.1 hypothetical protein CBS147338_4815 [Penicillium roqueforti]KAI3157133.1 hypothetical protein CBS147325_833 [Penicillium roqueforti]KAI3183619.1 hypothetical protein DTO046C5_634 [Penicillium roqueforti]KAI3193305.1 hypothetical protein DTO032C6_495 [Penicillium roqueforti]